MWHYQNNLLNHEYYDPRITPSMSSLEALLSKLPSVEAKEENEAGESSMPPPYYTNN